MVVFRIRRILSILENMRDGGNTAIAGLLDIVHAKVDLILKNNMVLFLLLRSFIGNVAFYIRKRCTYESRNLF